MVDQYATPLTIAAMGWAFSELTTAEPENPSGSPCTAGWKYALGAPGSITSDWVASVAPAWLRYAMVTLADLAPRFWSCSPVLMPSVLRRTRGMKSDVWPPPRSW